MNGSATPLFKILLVFRTIIRSIKEAEVSVKCVSLSISCVKLYCCKRSVARNHIIIKVTCDDYIVNVCIMGTVYALHD